ncbi:Putative protein [Zobellia galactanivorans]|uniref:Uncharacterized protein n=1 Tax=Zobellia galactanivorans (strain DSM 12802 / CCUG 47099 / CIP 106680 / NCIMB 13871 / Dsij) TaxID=63186 RepID=G0LBP7_ZOBGA|nr:Putative protein [Zobellia galactanivorans]
MGTGLKALKMKGRPPGFWKVEILCGGLKPLSIRLNSCRIIDFRKNDFYRKAMLAKHSGYHSWGKLN